MLDAAAEDIDLVETAGAVLENVGECVVWFNCADPDSPGSQLQRERADPGSVPPSLLPMRSRESSTRRAAPSRVRLRTRLTEAQISMPMWVHQPGRPTRSPAAARQLRNQDSEAQAERAEARNSGARRSDCKGAQRRQQT